MDGSDSHFSDHSSPDARRARALKEQRTDFDDLQHELAGRETGKMARFTSEDERARRSGKVTEAQKVREHQTLLTIMLADPDYAAAYNDVMDMLRNAEMRTQAAIDKTESRLQDNDNELDDIQSRASTLPDGTRVYRDIDGNVFNEDGAQIHPPETDTIVWRDDNPSHEEYLANRQRDTALRDYLERLRDYQIRLGGYRNEMEDQTTPPIQDDLENIKQGIIEQEPVSTLHENQANFGNTPVSDNIAETQKPSL